jgi:hypothetical protein
VSTPQDRKGSVIVKIPHQLAAGGDFDFRLLPEKLLIIASLFFNIKSYLAFLPVKNPGQICTVFFSVSSSFLPLVCPGSFMPRAIHCLITKR